MIWDFKSDERERGPQLGCLEAPVETKAPRVRYSRWESCSMETE